VAGIGAAFRAAGHEPPSFPHTTAHGALGRHVSSSDPLHYEPRNIAFGVLPDLETSIRDKRLKREALSRRALEALDAARGAFELPPDATVEEGRM